mgnify:CR=1 FL=1
MDLVFLAVTVALAALTWAYCVLPCVLKLSASAMLWLLWMRSPYEDRR